MYNQSYIDVFPIEKYESTLSSKEKLSKVRTDYSYRFNNQADAYYLAFKESLDHYVYKKILENPNFVNSEQFRNYFSYVLDLLSDSKVEINGVIYYKELTDNIIFRSGIVKDTIFFRIKQEMVDNIKKYRSSNINLLKRILESMKKHENLSYDDISFIAEYIYSNQDANQDVMDTYIEYMLNYLPKNMRPNVPIIGAMVTCYCKKYSNDERVQANTRAFIAYYDHGAKFSFAHSKHDYRYITFHRNVAFSTDLYSSKSMLSQRSLNNIDLYWIMWVTFHELTHQHQYEDIDRGLLSSSALSMTICDVLEKYMPKSDGGKTTDYHMNHDSDEIEMQADEEGWREARKFIHKYVNRSNRTFIDHEGVEQDKWGLAMSNEREVCLRRTFSLKKDIDTENREYNLNDNEKTLGTYYAIYDIKNLIRIVKEHPSTIQKFPLLGYLFTKDGSFNYMRAMTCDLCKNTKVDTISQNHDNYTGLELCTYTSMHYTDEICKYIEQNGISEKDAYSLLSSFRHVFYDGAHKFKAFKDVDAESFKETNTRFDFNREDVIHNAFLYHYKVAIQGMVNEKRVFNLIKSKYPNYKLYSRKQYESDHYYYLASPFNMILDKAGLMDSEYGTNNPTNQVYINLLKNPRIMEILNIGRQLGEPQVDSFIDFAMEEIKKLKEQDTAKEISGSPRK